jgi:hypothetical protein
MHGIPRGTVSRAARYPARHAWYRMRRLVQAARARVRSVEKAQGEAVRAAKAEAHRLAAELAQLRQATHGEEEWLAMQAAAPPPYPSPCLPSLHSRRPVSGETPRPAVIARVLGHGRLHTGAREDRHAQAVAGPSTGCACMHAQAVRTHVVCTQRSHLGTGRARLSAPEAAAGLRPPLPHLHQD